MYKEDLHWHSIYFK